MSRISKCISCDGGNLKYYDENKTLKLPIHICQDCGLHITGEDQNELDMVVEELYETDFWDSDRQNLFDDHSDSYSLGRRRLFISQIKYLSSIISKSSKILEIGSGHGETITELEKLQYNVTGVEPDIKNVEFLKNQLNSRIIQSNIESLKLDEKFDLIWMSHVFEHLSNPIKSLKDFKNFLNPNGIIFIEVPSVTKKNDQRTFTVVPHAYNYSSKSLKNILIKSGYSIISCDHFGPPTKIQGLTNKIFKKLFKRDYYKFYPKILLNEFTGQDIRIIAKMKMN